MGFISIAQPLVVADFADLGTLFERRVFLGPAREPAFGPPRGPAAGFRRLRRCAELRQKCRNGKTDPYRHQAAGIVATLLGQPPICHALASQTYLCEGGDDQPRPPVGLLWVPKARGAPTEFLLEEAEGVLQAKPADLGTP